MPKAEGGLALLLRQRRVVWSNRTRPPLSLRDISPAKRGRCRNRALARVPPPGDRPEIGAHVKMNPNVPTVGKFPPELLFSALRGVDDSRVVQGPGPGADAAIIEWGDRALVATSDPITFVDAEAGRLAVTVNSNDIWAVGAEPEWMLATILAPPGTQRDQISSLLADIQSACDQAEIALVGGHTEITDAVTRTVVSCALLGSAPLDRVIRSNGAVDGDLIVQAGPAAVEGTAILGHPQLFDDPGISIAVAARALRRVDGVHAMHDVTEGGIATAALELVEAAGLGIELQGDQILWLPQTLEVCRERGLDPLGLLGSGALLAAVAPAAADPAPVSYTHLTLPTKRIV